MEKYRYGKDDIDSGAQMFGLMMVIFLCAILVTAIVATCGMKPIPGPAKWNVSGEAKYRATQSLKKD